MLMALTLLLMQVREIRSDHPAVATNVIMSDHVSCGNRDYKIIWSDEYRPVVMLNGEALVGTTSENDVSSITLKRPLRNTSYSCGSSGYLVAASVWAENRKTGIRTYYSRFTSDVEKRLVVFGPIVGYDIVKYMHGGD